VNPSISNAVGVSYGAGAVEAEPEKPLSPGGKKGKVVSPSSRPVSKKA